MGRSTSISSILPLIVARRPFLFEYEATVRSYELDLSPGSRLLSNLNRNRLFFKPFFFLPRHEVWCWHEEGEAEIALWSVSDYDGVTFAVRHHSFEPLAGSEL